MVVYLKIMFICKKLKKLFKIVFVTSIVITIAAIFWWHLYTARVFKGTAQELVLPRHRVETHKRDQNQEIQIEYQSKCDCKKDKKIILRRESSSHEYFVYETRRNTKDDVIKLYSISTQEYENSILTCDHYNTLRRGKHQKVISYSLYGRNRFYYNKLKSLTQTIRKLYPGWFMRVYYDDSVDKSIICDIECTRDVETNELIDNSDFCNVNSLKLKLNEEGVVLNANYTHKMKWRWFPIGDSFVDVFSSRDTDSFILQREVDSVNVWLKSNKIGHVMRDHSGHGYFLIPGGMWGFFSARNRHLSYKIFRKILHPLNIFFYNYKKDSPKGADQIFLNDFVYNLIKSNSTVHDSFFCDVYGGEPWPTQRLGNCFVGNPFECDVTAAFETCPIQCRPKNHIDWEKC
jgi:hypothetical protein